MKRLYLYVRTHLRVQDPRGILQFWIPGCHLKVQLISKMATKQVTSTQVLFFYPNLIGYLRILCMWMSFYYASSEWKLSIIFYAFAFVGDVVDGYVARACKQSKTK